jgi:selenide, water dikinase
LQQKNVVLIGAGHAHVEVIRRLGNEKPANTAITLISDTSQAGYSGMMPGVIAGHYHRREAEVDVPALCARTGVRFIHEPVQRIMASSNAVQCATTQVAFDWLSVNSGSQPRTPALTGAQHVRVKPFAQFLDGLPALLQREHIAVVGGGAASVEVLLALAHARQGFGKLTLLCGAPDILAGYPARVIDNVKCAMTNYGTRWQCGVVVSGCHDAGLSLGTGEMFPCDASLWCTPAGPSAFIAESDLARARDGFIHVDAFQRSVSHPNVFAVGDCASRDAVLQKAGVVPVKQGPWLAEALRACAMGNEKTITPFVFQKHALALLALGGKRATGYRGDFVFNGRWAWTWKDFIDRRFMRKYA